MKFPTGDYEMKDSTGTLLPARFQPGGGVACPLLGARYLQSFGSLRIMATLLWEISGGENSVGYKRGDRLNFDATAYYPLYSKFSLVGGLGYSLNWIASEDRQDGARVDNTDGTFHSICVTGIATLYKQMSVILMVKMPFGSTSKLENKLDFQYIFGFSYKF
ncbi:hypothetical protein KY317_03785 [Candidatus Woesearchaeota archaeon]|nr:hypothetical protein [Candidatus Woesearchaeota archaeon]